MKPKKLKSQSVEGSRINLDALYAIAPSCFTEVRDEQTGEVRRVVDLDTLRTLLGDDTAEAGQEQYRFTWPGKQAARLEAAQTTTETLRPVPEESLDWETTENIYIEGDNLRVLKLLQKSYLGKVKMIYIDPPYNTGNDFVYNDDFARSATDEELAAGNIDEEGLRYRKNSDSNGRFHSDWCSMIYSRLMVARTLLAEDGVIFISIDDNEVHNLRKICDEVFGASNFVAEFIWRGGRRNAAKFISTSHEYMLCYASSLHYCREKNISWDEKKKGLNEIYKIAETFVKETNGNYDLASNKLKKWFKDLPGDSPSKDHAHYILISIHEESIFLLTFLEEEEEVPSGRLLIPKRATLLQLLLVGGHIHHCQIYKLILLMIASILMEMGCHAERVI